MCKVRKVVSDIGLMFQGDVDLENGRDLRSRPSIAYPNPIRSSEAPVSPHYNVFPTPEFPSPPSFGFISFQVNLAPVYMAMDIVNSISLHKCSALFFFFFYYSSSSYAQLELRTNTIVSNENFMFHVDGCCVVQVVVASLFLFCCSRAISLSKTNSFPILFICKSSLTTFLLNDFLCFSYASNNGLVLFFAISNLTYLYPKK